MTRDEEVAALRAENALLRRELAVAQALIAQLQARIADLEQRKAPTPGFVKANTERTERAEPRKKRAPEHNAGRPRTEPTQTVQHAYERCPDCGYLLRGESVARTREVIDLPPPPPVVVTAHQILKRYCPVCQRWQVPSPDWSGQVLGHGRLGVRLVSLIAYLRTQARLPVRTIQEYLATLHQVHLSTGAIVDLLTRLRDATAAERASLLAQARASPSAHGRDGLARRRPERLRLGPDDAGAAGRALLSLRPQPRRGGRHHAAGGLCRAPEHGLLGGLQCL